jgi:cbb3-type cytochrome c oxidase subunit III
MFAQFVAAGTLITVIPGFVRFATLARLISSEIMKTPGSGRLRLAGLATIALLWAVKACGQSGSPSQNEVVPTIAHAIKQSNRVYLGWRVFHDNCARCHGPDATGTDKAPDLRVRVKPMSSAQFVGTVLRRYGWVLPSGQTQGESGVPAREIRALVERRSGEIVMPAWESEPAVKAHIADLYDYLQARASGALGPGRPPWSGK